ncbi:hypothetical protein FJ414_28305, partial [Mesorhizobium sp. B3-1-6]|uniref:hypothetical protein n=1 Tax=Mesorhizobium sp. B3-1-6 TaxID=2589895 RepID=UPI00112A2377
MAKWVLVLIGMVWSTTADAQQTFGGYDCTEDCSGHKAGYDWAQQNSVSDTSDCSGNSQSFVEGCDAYVEDPNRGSDEDDDGNEID